MIQILPKIATLQTNKRIAVAALTALAFGLLGAVRYQPVVKAEHVHGPAATEVVAADAVEDAEVAAFHMKHAASGELLHDAPVALSAVPASPIAKAQKSRVVWMQVTAYCPCKRCCGPSAQGLTASGRTIAYNGGQFVAADTRLLPFNTKLIIPGYADGATVQVIDRGGAIKGNHIDLFFPTHDQARQWGVKWMQITVLE